MRYLLKKWKLDAKKDVTLVRDAELGGACRGQRRPGARSALSTEPLITHGIKQGLWSEPFFNVPKELGPYAYSTINIRQESIKKEPEVVQRLRARHDEGPRNSSTPTSDAAEIAKKQFPTMALEDLKATLDRSFADQMWSKDGMISRAAWDTGKAVVMERRYAQDRRQL